MSTSALIAGAGPVGLTMAIELARFQVPVRIVDKSSGRTDKSKALAVWSRTLELLDRSGCTQKLIDAGRKTRAVNIMSGRKIIARVAFDDLESPFPFVLMVPQSETERVLEEELETFGVKVERNVELIDFTDFGSEVACNLLHPDGRNEATTADWLIGCDGAHSLIRHRLAMPFEGNIVPGTFVLADVHVSGLDLPEDEFPIFWHRNGMVAFFPIDKTRYRVIADTGIGQQHDPTLEDMQTIVDQRGPSGILLSDCVWIAPFTINERKVKDFRAGRVFLVGDAAHIHSPAGGQGMNTGIQDAINLAWKVAMVVNNRANADLLLSSYSIERSANAVQVLKDSGRMLRMATVSSVATQTIRDFLVHHLFGLSFVRHKAADRLAELTVEYVESPLNGSDAKGMGFPRPGHRITGDAASVAGTSGRFAVIASDTEHAQARLKNYAHLLADRVVDTGNENGICLVRPDGYVAMTTHANGWNDLIAYLDRIALA